MLTVNLFAPNPLDMTSFYRAVGPFSRLRKLVPDLHIQVDKDLDWGRFMMSDIVVFQRPFNPMHAKAIELSKQFNKPIWVDFDDDVINVPSHNPYAHIYNQPAVKSAIYSSLQAADVVTVSTEDLKEKFLKFNTNVHVVPNALDADALNYRNIQWKRNPIVSWRGGNTHINDILSVKNAYKNVAEKHKDWQFMFFGQDPKLIMHGAVDSKRLGFMPEVEALVFFKNLHNTQAPIHTVPLVDDTFNRSKSNIAWIEATWAGSAVIAPDWLEWKKPGCVTYQNEMDFYNQMNTLIENPNLIKECNEASWNYIKENLTLDKVNIQRAEILNSLRKKVGK